MHIQVYIYIYTNACCIYIYLLHTTDTPRTQRQRACVPTTGTSVRSRGGGSCGNVAGSALSRRRFTRRSSSLASSLGPVSSSRLVGSPSSRRAVRARGRARTPAKTRTRAHGGSTADCWPLLRPLARPSSPFPYLSHSRSEKNNKKKKSLGAPSRLRVRCVKVSPDVSKSLSMCLSRSRCTEVSPDVSKSLPMVHTSVLRLARDRRALSRIRRRTRSHTRPRLLHTATDGRSDSSVPPVCAARRALWHV